MNIFGRLCETGQNVYVHTEDQRIVSVAAADPVPDGLTFDLGGEDVLISPGWLDLQVNGYGGFDFNRGFWAGEDAPEAVSHIVGLAARAGTAMLCPTVCTNSFDAMRSSFAAIHEAIEADPTLAHAIPAVHMEGPYLADEDGPRGAHPREHVRDPDWGEFQRFQEAAGGRIRLLTLAPERPGAIRFIERLTAADVTVALGHTGASADQIRDAVQAGAKLSTHLGNAAHSVLPRHPNYIWEQLACDSLSASVIADGHHLPSSVLKSFARVKGPDRLILVSDAVALGGLPPGIYNEGRHEVLPGGKVVLAGTPYLAGAGHLLDVCVVNALRVTDLGMAGVVRAVSANPAQLLGLESRKGCIAAGKDADLTLFRLPEDGPLEIVATIRSGETVYASERL